MLNQKWPDEVKLELFLDLFLQQIQRKGVVRKHVDDRDAAESFNYYSLLNRFALDAIQSLSGHIHNQDVFRGVSGALSLAWAKEYAGQLRGKVNGVIAKQQVSDIARLEITEYITDFNITNKYLSLILADEEKKQLEKTLNSVSYQKFSNVQSSILSDENVEFTMSSEQWFTLATGQIVELKKILDQQWSIQHQRSQQIRSKSMVLFISETIGLIIVLTILAILNIYIVRSMRLRLRKLTRDLQEIANNGDLSVDIRLKGGDELGAISHSMHRTFTAFKELIMGLMATIESGKRIGGELNIATTNVMRNAEQSHLLASNIATSLEEMSQTSEEIAKSAVSTFNASDRLQQKNSQNIEGNLANSNALKTMSQNMLEVRHKANRMEEQVTAISSILETINSLADQTNLLALNAAIEAARAGEAGRGFAVVADEVRKLAKGSKSSSDSISKLLLDLQSASNEVVVSIEANVSTAQDSLHRAANVEVLSSELVTQVSELEQLSTTSAAAAEEQAVTIKHIAKDTTEVLDSSNSGLSIAKNLEDIFSALATNDKSLQQMIESFTIDRYRK